MYLIQGAYPVRLSLPSVVGNERIRDAPRLCADERRAGPYRALGPDCETCRCQGLLPQHPDVELKIPNALRETAPLVASVVIRVPIAATYRLTAFREVVAHVRRGGAR